MAAHTAPKSAADAGTVGGFAQSRSARPRTSVAQHCAVPVRPEQSGMTWRLSSPGVDSETAAGAGAASATAAKRAAVMMENCIFGGCCFV